MTDFPELDCQQRSELFIDVIKFTPEKEQKALASLKMHASPGPDDISPILKKICVPSIRNLITFNITDLIQFNF